MQWINSHDLQSQPRLAQTLQVESGWEKAVETVLDDVLQAISVDNITTLFDRFDTLPEGNIAFYTDADKKSCADNSLASKIISNNIPPRLYDIFVADDISNALVLLPHLQPQQSIITRDGIWLSQHWLKQSVVEDAKGGVIKREKELQELAELIACLNQTIEDLQQQINEHKTNIADLEDEREEKQASLTSVKITLGEIHSQLDHKQKELIQLQKREQQLKNDIADIGSALQEDELLLSGSRQKWQQALMNMEGDEEKRQQFLTRRDNCREALEFAREHSRSSRDEYHQIELQVQNIHAQIESLKEITQRLQKQYQTTKNRLEQLRQMLSENEAPLESMGEELQQHLEKRLIVEKELHEARSKVENLEQQLRNLTKERNNEEESSQTIRSQLERLRMDWQGYAVKRDTILDNINVSDFNLETLQNEMPEEAAIAPWQEKIADLERKIQRLGNINLAAIDEYDMAVERKKYLDAQNDDLVEALETLENAIRKIDKETRTRLRETFDSAKANFQANFPKIFGGGSADLELTGDDLLECGVRVMARPPGKRNSTIHLLSGGEKALTAIALVFALFQLNPAPFCLLDEVDAPLDDVNVGRFCELVKEMSKQVQFLVITHNKVTMEMMHQLTGVTMHEPGVSRLVAVDVDEAVSLVEA